MPTPRPFYKILKSQQHVYVPDEIVKLFSQIDEKRLEFLATSLAQYISANLPLAINRRDGLADYRTNPYVLMTCANVMKLSKPEEFAKFLFDTKFYMGLETSFGKSMEAACVNPYPIKTKEKWIDPPEKVAEGAALGGLTNEEKALQRTSSKWREIDKSVVIDSRRYLISIKSGPNCINDTQVQAMTAAIVAHHKEWMDQSKRTYPRVRELDVIIGITYGTDRTSNNKENQILVKLMGQGFIEEDRQEKPGVLIDQETRSTRVYRRIGKEFWSFIGDPGESGSAGFVFLEILLALAKGLSKGLGEATLETRINLKMAALATALDKMILPTGSLPEWIRKEFSENELFWFTTAMTAFYDQGI